MPEESISNKTPVRAVLITLLTLTMTVLSITCMLLLPPLVLHYGKSLQASFGICAAYFIISAKICSSISHKLEHSMVSLFQKLIAFTAFTISAFSLVFTTAFAFMYNPLPVLTALLAWVSTQTLAPLLLFFIESFSIIPLYLKHLFSQILLSIILLTPPNPFAISTFILSVVSKTEFPSKNPLFLGVINNKPRELFYNLYHKTTKESQASQETDPLLDESPSETPPINN